MDAIVGSRDVSRIDTLIPGLNVSVMSIIEPGSDNWQPWLQQCDVRLEY